MSKYIDYDAARAERKQEPLIVKLFDQEWELPPELPAIIQIESARMQAELGPDAPVSGAKVNTLLSHIVPEDILMEWCHRGLGSEEYGELLTWIINKYQERKANQGEAPAPKAGASA